MKFSASESEVQNAIEVLDRLINEKNSSNVMESIRRYKNTGDVDMFTSFRLNKQLQKMGKGLR